MKKTFDLPLRSIEIIHEFMQEKGFKTEVDTVIYLIEQSKNEKLLVDKIKEEFKSDFVRFRLGLRTAEQNSIVIKDILNTILYFYDIENIFPAKGETIHKAVKESEDNLRQLIKQLKQEKDDKKSRLNEV